MLIKNMLSCRIGHRPNSSLQGAHSSHPKLYRTKYTHWPTRAACSLMLKCSASGVTALGKTDVLKFIDTWMQAMAQRKLHFFHLGQLYASLS